MGKSWKRTWVSCVVLCMAVVAAGAESRVQAYRVSKPITVDGALGEEAWQHLPVVTGFIYVNQMDTYSALQSAFRVGYDDEHIYVGFRADEPLIARHLEHARQKDTGAASWDYQVCEVFMDVPDAEGRTNHYQFALDLLGYRAAYQVDRDRQPADAGAPTWKASPMTWQGAVHHGSDFYSMEMAIPVKALGAPPKNRDEWGFQIGRHGTWTEGALKGLHWKTAAWTAWASMPSAAWRVASEHGVLEFVDEVLIADDQNVGKRTLAINRAFEEWKATHGEAMQKVQALLDKTEGLVDVCYGTNNAQQADGMVFGQRRGPPSREKVANWTWHWWFKNTGNPQVVTLTWKQPVTFNCNKIEWGSPTCYGREYALEYWTGAEWRLAYGETNGCLPLACHAFPAVTTTRARLSIASVVAESWNVTVPGFELYRLPDDVLKGVLR